MAFTHELWRMKVKKDANEASGKAWLALISSNVLAFLLNLFPPITVSAKTTLDVLRSLRRRCL
jgi:hypothetical protein